MTEFEKKSLKSGIGIIGIIAITTALVVLTDLSAWAFVLAAFACIPLAKDIWNYALHVYNNPIRLLRKTLPKIGYAITKTEWDDEHDKIALWGEYRGDKFLIRGSNSNAFVFIYDFPWWEVDTTDPNIPRILEAINDVNTNRAHISVCLGEPNEENKRQVFTHCTTVLPTYNIKGYLDFILTDILNRKPDFGEALNRERPYMHQRRGPIGFNMQSASQDEEPMAPAAQNSSEING